MSQIYAPFTPEQVEALNRYQQSDYVHPFTCDRRSDGLHGKLWNDTGTLVATALRVIESGNVPSEGDPSSV